ncbi:MAG TPA: response regulator [Candidatus Synoicihabitans sp.]|nr:response regulator [Candidatus Synoicihabitans sp.]
MKFSGKVLIVDDEAHVRKYISLIVQATFKNSRVAEATNGNQALELYATDRPDLVLLDVNMPFRDGLSTLRELRSRDPQSVIVMMTSVANRQTVVEALELGAANYIRKDTPREEVAKALEETVADLFEP